MFFVFFIIILPIAVLLILLLSTKQKTNESTPQAEITEVCALCNNDFPMNQLLEKEIGHYGRVYCFCRECVEKLYNELKDKTELETGA